MAVTVATILSHKGTDVHTIDPDVDLASAVAALAANNVGALVVSADGTHVDGIVSERDVVRVLQRRGPECLADPVRAVMTADVTTCQRGDTSDQLMARMTTSRIRHLPVIEDDRLAGIISIGDVVRSRMDELETQAKSLRDYITGSSY